MIASGSPSTMKIRPPFSSSFLRSSEGWLRSMREGTNSISTSFWLQTRHIYFTPILPILQDKRQMPLIPGRGCASRLTDVWYRALGHALRGSGWRSVPRAQHRICYFLTGDAFFLCLLFGVHFKIRVWFYFWLLFDGIHIASFHSEKQKPERDVYHQHSFQRST